MRPLLFLLLAVVTLSCADLKPKEVNLYYDLQSFLVDQGVSLNQDKVELQKRAIVNNDSSINSFVPDSLGWANEFQLMMDADINKPALRGQYIISQLDDENSNLKIQEYTASSKELPIQSFKIYYLDNIEKIKKIEIAQRESNSIFESSKNIVIHIDEIKQRNRITSYTIKGYQKMLLQDRVDFNVSCTLKY